MISLYKSLTKGRLFWVKVGSIGHLGFRVWSAVWDARSRVWRLGVLGRSGFRS